MRISSPSKTGRPCGAFTLVELMVAVLIVTLLSLLLASMTANAQRVFGYVLRRTNSSEMARLALGRLSYDIQGMFPRRDVPFLVSAGAAGTPFLGILTAVPAVSGDRQIAAIYYRIAVDQNSGAIFKTGHLTLQRAAMGIGFSQAGFVGVSVGAGAAVTPIRFADLPSALQPTASDYDVLADGVLAVNISLQRRSDGRMVSAPPTTANGTALADGDPDLAQIGAFAVTLVVLDSKSFGLLNAAQVDAIAAKFQPPSEADFLAGKLAAEEWATLIDDPSRFPGIPPAAIRSLHVYQRFIPLAAPSN